MANIVRKLFGDSPIPPPTHINLTATTLHKHDPTNGFSLTLEATLPQTPNTPNKPLTILVFNTLLDPSSIALYEDGLNFINIDTGTPAKRTTIIYEYSFGGRSNIPVNTQFECYFVTLHPGVPYRVKHTLRPCPRIRPWPRLHKEDNDNPEWLDTSLRERVATAEDEDIVALVFSHVTYLDVGSTYRVELGDRLNRISWYRYGSKEEILGEQGAGGVVGGLMRAKRRRRRELVGDSEMQVILLVIQGSASFIVEE